LDLSDYVCHVCIVCFVCLVCPASFCSRPPHLTPLSPSQTPRSFFFILRAPVFFASLLSSQSLAPIALSILSLSPITLLAAIANPHPPSGTHHATTHSTTAHHRPLRPYPIPASRPSRSRFPLVAPPQPIAAAVAAAVAVSPSPSPCRRRCCVDQKGSKQGVRRLSDNVGGPFHARMQDRTAHSRG